jgi:hypothetical protein
MRQQISIKTDEATDIRWTKIDDIENIIEDCPETIFPMDTAPTAGQRINK